MTPTLFIYKAPGSPFWWIYRGAAKIGGPFLHRSDAKSAARAIGRER